MIIIQKFSYKISKRFVDVQGKWDLSLREISDGFASMLCSYDPWMWWNRIKAANTECIFEEQSENSLVQLAW